MNAHTTAIVVLAMGAYALFGCFLASWVVDTQRRGVYIILCMQMFIMIGVSALYLAGVDVEPIGGAIRPLFLSIFITIGSLGLIDWYRNR